MSDDSSRGDQAVEKSEEETVETQETTETSERGSEAVLDAEAVEERERSTEELRSLVNEQNERIEELEDLLLDLSARAADGGGTGVCPDCHGPVVKVSPLLRRSRIKCTKCGRVFHEY